MVSERTQRQVDASLNKAEEALNAAQRGIREKFADSDVLWGTRTQSEPKLGR